MQSEPAILVRDWLKLMIDLVCHWEQVHKSETNQLSSKAILARDWLELMIDLVCQLSLGTELPVSTSQSKVNNADFGVSSRSFCL